MINETLQSSPTEQKPIPFGVRLQAAREALGMDRKDAAAQLRLHETMITMIESGEFTTDLPLTFIRGYIRNYSKLLEIPELEIKSALELLKPKPDIEESTSVPATVHISANGPTSTSTRSMPASIGNFFMQLFTYLIAITLIGLVGIWWHSHKAPEAKLPILQDTFNQAMPSDTEHATPALNAHSTDTNQATTESKSHAALSSHDYAADLVNTHTVPPGANTAQETIANTASTPDAHAPTAVSTIPRQSAANHPLMTATTKSLSLMDKYAYLFNRGDKTALTNLLTGDYYTQSLAHFIIFLLIVNISLHQYYYPLKTITTETRPRRTPRIFKSPRNLGNVLIVPKPFKMYKVILFFTLIIVVSILLWQYEHPKTQPIKSLEPIVKKQKLGANPQQDTAWDTLMPSPSLSTILMAQLRVNALQRMSNQLNDYVSQASATYFSLTDSSTPIGEFTYKKKVHKRHHRTYYNIHDTNDNTDPYDNETNNTIAE